MQTDNTPNPMRHASGHAMHMRWLDLLFAHWSVDVASLRAAVPQPLELDLHEGQAWLAVVPFVMAGTRPRGVPPLPGVSGFPELNLRTYVRYAGRAGVYFFSLDAGRRIPVWLARGFFGLPYFNARMSVRTEGDNWIEYRSERTDGRGASTSLRARYRPVGPIRLAVSGSLEHFLTERYCFFTVNRSGVVHRGDIDHEPWPLQPAEWQVEECQMSEQIGMALPDVPPLLHYARRLDVRGWLPKRAGC